MTVGIIGGGIMGVSLGYFLSRQGIPVEIFEASPALGGLAGAVTLSDGTTVDRFYHAVLSSDGQVIELCRELGLSDRLRFRQTPMGFLHDGDIYSMNSVLELLRFPLLGWIDRLRLGFTVFYAQCVRDWRRLDAIDVERWLVWLSGRRAYDSIWRPLLKAKFDGPLDELPATYIWSRLVRMKSTRNGASQKEMAGHLIGGYTTLVEAMAAEIERAGGRIHRGQPVDEIVMEQGEVRGLKAGGGFRPYHTVVSTVPTPLLRPLLPVAAREYADRLAGIRYLDLVMPLLVLDRPLTGCWTLNIVDDGCPFTGVIETTSYIDPQYVGGHHLVCLPKYTLPGSHWLELPDEAIREMWLRDLERILPSFDRSWVRDFLVHRARHVEPLHGLNQADDIPDMQTPIRGLYLAGACQIYPALTNVESVTRHAHRAAELIASVAR